MVVGRAARGVDGAQLRAGAGGLLARGVAFTDHLDFTTWTDGDQIGAENLDLHRYTRMHLLDLPGYLATLDHRRQRYPDLRILSGVEIGEAHLWAASAAAIQGSPPSTGSSARCTRSPGTGG